MKDFAPIITVKATQKNLEPLLGWLYLLFLLLFSFWVVALTPTVVQIFTAYFLSAAAVLCAVVLAVRVPDNARTNKRK